MNLRPETNKHNFVANWPRSNLSRGSFVSKNLNLLQLFQNCKNWLKLNSTHLIITLDQMNTIRILSNMVVMGGQTVILSFWRKMSKNDKVQKTLSLHHLWAKNSTVHHHLVTLVEGAFWKRGMGVGLIGRKDHQKRKNQKGSKNHSEWCW